MSKRPLEPQGFPASAESRKLVTHDGKQMSPKLGDQAAAWQVADAAHEKPDTDVGLIANIFPGSIMRTAEQHPLAPSAHKVTQEQKWLDRHASRG